MYNKYIIRGEMPDIVFVANVNHDLSTPTKFLKTPMGDEYL